MLQVEGVVELKHALATRRDELIAFVPTMGALHPGHLALIEKARGLASTTVLSIFVNPLQFGDPSDLVRYPKNLEADSLVAKKSGVDILWAPREEDIYPTGLEIARVDPGPLGNIYEGAIRPGHFAGVLTVVSRLFEVVHPDIAVFGEKDRQQLELVRRMAHGRVEIVGVPTVREADGLALSSRNRFLDSAQRDQSLVISRAIRHAQRVGNEGVPAVTSAVDEELKDLEIEYRHLVDAKTWDAVSDDFSGIAILLIAAKVGSVHLIDNGTVSIG
jgi:pantoate--beta-alanine ligase